MKRDSGLFFSILLILGDALTISLSFLVAYFLRTHVDQRPYYFKSDPGMFMMSMLWIIPIYLIIIAAFGLYRKAVFANRNRVSEFGRLLLVSIIGVMTIISYDFFMDADLFPVRVIAAYLAIANFVMLYLFRIIVRVLRKITMNHKKATLRALIVGSTTNTEYLANHIAAFPESGFTLAGIVASKKYIPQDLRKKQVSSLKEALRRRKIDVILQTDDKRTEYVYQQAVNRHLLYYFVPSNTMLSSQMGELELIGETPAILVKVTPLIGSARFAKRLMDIVLGGLLLIIAAIPMLIIWILQKINDFSAPAIYKETRLSRYNRRFKIYKFRSMKMEYSGISPEEAFKKMGKPELIAKYRANGDQITNDPRITKLGAFLRATSLDELPQLFNVIKGDISLVGPRALVPGELKHYGDKSQLLSVKSGLTGLAQVSGRRDISFEERRALDLYYVRNWSLKMDFRILAQTVGAVLFRRGAK